MVDNSCQKKPTFIATASYRVDLFNGRMSGVLMSSIFVTAIGKVTVAHLGTWEGRVLQVSLETRSCGSCAISVIICCISRTYDASWCCGLGWKSYSFTMFKYLVCDTSKPYSWKPPVQFRNVAITNVNCICCSSFHIGNSDNSSLLRGIGILEQELLASSQNDNSRVLCGNL